MPLLVVTFSHTRSTLYAWALLISMSNRNLVDCGCKTSKMSAQTGNSGDCQTRSGAHSILREYSLKIPILISLNHSIGMLMDQDFASI